MTDQTGNQVTIESLMSRCDMAAGPYKMVVSRWMVEQFRFPRSKKGRIRRKWAKCQANWMPMLKGMLFNGTLYIHPAVKSRIDNMIPRS